MYLKAKNSLHTAQISSNICIYCLFRKNQILQYTFNVKLSDSLFALDNIKKKVRLFILLKF